jgi:protein SCO1/2
MLRTALACVLLALGGWAAARWLTYDFQVWTDEGARRLEVALNPVPAPPVTLQGPALPAPAAMPAVLGSGGVTIADFFYTRCETVCLSLGSSFQQLQAALQAEPASGVRLLSISFDGAYDNPKVLQAYAGQLGADAATWRFASVPNPAEQALLLRRLGVVVIPNGLGDFEHNAALLVFDTRGRMVRVFDLAEQQLALDYARHLSRTQTP